MDEIVIRTSGRGKALLREALRELRCGVAPWAALPDEEHAREKLHEIDRLIQQVEE